MSKFKKVVEKLEVEPSKEIVRKQINVMTELRELGATEEQLCNLMATTVILALRQK